MSASTIPERAQRRDTVMKLRVKPAERDRYIRAAGRNFSQWARGQLNNGVRRTQFGKAQ